MPGQRFNNGSTHVLCENCQRVVEVHDYRPLPSVEPRFLRSDYFPSASERPHLRNILQEAEREIEWYEANIVALRQTLDQMEKEKRVVEVTTNQYRAALSTHRRVPVEVWEIIFSTLCLSLCEYSFDTDYSSPASPLLRLPAILISQVCTHWRVIAEKMPSIWSSISVDLSEPPYNVDIPLKVYLSNSNEHLLKLRIRGEEPSSVLSRVSEPWRMISSHVYKSRMLTMVLNWSGDYLPPIDHLAFPHLESYYQESRYPPDKDIWPWFWKAIEEAPQLTTVSSAEILDPHDGPIPYPQLITWEARMNRSYEVANLLEILPTCKNLSSLTLSEIMSHEILGDPVAAQGIIELPSLRRLSVSAHDDQHNWLASILQFLAMPSLEKCFVECTRFSLPSSLLTMVQRSSTTLTNFTIRYYGLITTQTLEFLFNLLQEASELTDFELILGGIPGRRDKSHYRSRVNEWVSTLLSKFKERPQVRDFLPKLGDLKLELPYVTLNTELMERVFEVVSARQKTSYSIRDFYLVRHTREIPDDEEFIIEPEVLKRIKLFRESGIEVVVGDVCVED
ncbi:hypothetical protein L218DRAFT_901303 [Marasmius fiardii PR-910]|nr:hypothetical protein L218DRAFT_901303 [Marasmius fiardii PR-910]